MQEVPCKLNDGFCTIPDRALVVRQGTVGVRTREEIAGEFPNLDLRVTNLRPFEFDGTHEELLAGARTLAADDIGDEGDGGLALMDSPVLRESVAAAIADAQLINGLIVLCSPCGHQWIVDV